MARQQDLSGAPAAFAVLDKEIARLRRALNRSGAETRMKRILVVEDDRTTQHLVSSILKGGGHAVTAVSDGAAALDELRRQDYDLVLTDIWMPHMNGLDLLAEMRKLPHPPRTVVLTSDTTPDTLLRALREQAYQFLTKPVQATELQDLVESALAAPAEIPPIEVISAKQDWVELLVPCEMSTAERIQGFIRRLDADLLRRCARARWARSSARCC